MTANQSLKIKIAGGNKQYEVLLHKDIEILRVEMDAKLSGFKAELSKTIYLTGLVQFLAIVGSVIAIVTFAMRH